MAEQVNLGDTNVCANLMTDIDMSGITWSGIGSEKHLYNGVFDGNGKTINNLTGSEGLFKFKIDSNKTMPTLQLSLDNDNDGYIYGDKY